MRAKLLVAAFFALSLLGQASADAPAAAERAYNGGDYLAAASAAEAQQDAASQAFAARALMAACIAANDRSRIDPLLARAERAARTALRLDPESVDARIQWALALGVRARRASLAEAVARNYAPRGRRLLQEAITRDPSNAWAHSLLGGWHLEVIRRGGRAGAAAYGARLSIGMAEFERARALAPNDSMVMLHYAVSLLELDSHAYADRAEALLRQANATTPRDAFEAHTLGQARQLSIVLQRDGPAAAERAAERAFL